MKKGISQGPKFVRIKMPTVGLPLHKKWFVAFTRPRVELLEDYEVSVPAIGTIVLPKGMNSDGGSVPMFLIWAIASISGYVGGVWQVAGILLMLVAILLNPFGLMLVAFLVHDYAVRHGRLILKSGHEFKVKTVWQANRIMRRVNLQINDMNILDWIAHVGVTIGAWFAWLRYRQQERKR